MEKKTKIDGQGRANKREQEEKEDEEKLGYYLRRKQI